MSDQNSSTGLPPAAAQFAARMYDAAREGRMDIFQQALPAGLPAGMTNDDGNSLVMLAAYHGHAPLVRLLMEHGANPNSLNDRGQTPLAGAVFKMEDDVVEALLEGGADPEYGTPSATESIVIFKQEGKWKDKFNAAPGQGTGADTQPHMKKYHYGIESGGFGPKTRRGLDPTPYMAPVSVGPDSGSSAGSESRGSSSTLASMDDKLKL